MRGIRAAPLQAHESQMQPARNRTRSGVLSSRLINFYAKTGLSRAKAALGRWFARRLANFQAAAAGIWLRGPSTTRGHIGLNFRRRSGAVDKKAGRKCK